MKYFVSRNLKNFLFFFDSSDEYNSRLIKNDQ